MSIPMSIPIPMPMGMSMHMPTSFPLNYKTLLLLLVICFIIIIATNSSYFRTVNKIYNSLSKIPRLILMVATVLSLLGLSNTVDLTNFFKHTGIGTGAGGAAGIIDGLVKGKAMKIPLPDEEGKRLVSDTTKKFVAAKQEWKCGLCHKMLDETFEVDHVIPIYKGGSNEISNLMALDPICHRKKTNADRLNLAKDVFI